MHELIQLPALPLSHSMLGVLHFTMHGREREEEWEGEGEEGGEEGSEREGREGGMGGRGRGGKEKKIIKELTPSGAHQLHLQ